MNYFKTLAILLATAVTFSAHAAHEVLLVDEGRLVRLDASGDITWEMPWGSIHDIHLLPNGHILTVKDYRRVVEIDPSTKEIVWSYNAALKNGNKGKKLEIHGIQPLANGNVFIAESGPSRFIEIDREGNLLNEVAMKVDNPNAHRDTRLARKLENGNYLASHEGDGVIREYDSTNGKVVWEFTVPLFDKEVKGGHGPEAFGNSAFSAIRLENGNTLIGTGNGHSVLEVTRDGEILWQLHQNDLPDITFAWITTLELLPNGNLVIGNCHAGPGQPVLVEIDRATKDVVWTLDRFDDFGNNVTNSLVVNAAGKSIR